MSETTTKATSAKENWDRYNYLIGRGHDKYVWRAGRLEGFYLGGDIDERGYLMAGGQWNQEDLEILEEQGRPAYEANQIRPSVNSALGYQIHNRVDIAFMPAGGQADQAKAEIRSKLVMHILRQQQFHYQETQVFADGLIEQRGYFEVDVSFDNNMLGEARIVVLDPRDCAPDPDAKSYDPDGWSDFTHFRWLSMDEIEQQYGLAKRKEVESTVPEDRDFGEDDMSGARNRFGEVDIDYSSCSRVAGERRVRVLKRQQWRYTLADVAVHPTSGDYEPYDPKDTEKVRQLTEQGCIFTRRRTRKVWWTVSTEKVMLFDDWSPFPWFTVVPYFPYFRRGKTRGMVDIAVGPQQIHNKGLSQYIHIVNTTANSGWVVEEDSLSNMTTDELEDHGAQSGLVLEVKKGSQPPEKIKPNGVPSGIDKLIDMSLATIKDVTVPEAMRGENSQEISGVAIQSRQFASQQQLAVPLDNLSRTRHLVAQRLDWIISNFYDSERVILITDTDPVTGKEISEQITINQYDGQGWQNDMTIGKYDVVISEQPMQLTFENSQFSQALEIRKAGINVPDWAVVKHSNLTDKQEILNEMKAPQANPEIDAKVALISAQTDKTKAETVGKNIESFFSGTQAAQTIATIPAVAPITDALLKSGGYQDQNAPPIIPSVPGLSGIDSTMPTKNTDPRFPARTDNPAAGLNQGIETQQNDSVNTEFD